MCGQQLQHRFFAQQNRLSSGPLSLQGWWFSLIIFTAFPWSFNVLGHDGNQHWVLGGHRHPNAGQCDFSVAPGGCGPGTALGFPPPSQARRVQPAQTLPPSLGSRSHHFPGQSTLTCVHGRLSAASFLDMTIFGYINSLLVPSLTSNPGHSAAVIWLLLCLLVSQSRCHQHHR